MPLFFIEQGQGIVAAGNLRVSTSTLHNCTLIAGYNLNSGRGGAFHYPSNRYDQKSVREDMDAWAAELNPTALTLVFAKDASGGLFPGEGASASDRRDLQQWAEQKCDTVSTTEAVAAGMELVAGGYSAGNVKLLAGDFDSAKAIRLDHKQPGTFAEHGGYTLIGIERETSAGF